MHTDGINESCELDETVAAIAGRSIHAYHVEGIGGGHSPDILAIAGVGHVIGSSTTPTIPYGRNVVAEHHAMMWSVHGMNPRVPSDRAMIADRIRDSTMRAESVLHELGAISIINSDSQGMGRIGEVIRRTWQLAHQMKRMRGEQSGARQPADPAVPGQVHDQPRARPRRGPVGGVARAREERRHRALASRVLRRQAGARDQGRLPGLGRPRRGQRLRLADRAADLRAALGRQRAGGGEPQHRLRLGGRARPAASGRRLGTRRRAIPVVGTRQVAKRHMLYNQANPRIEIDPGSAEIRIDGQPLPPIPDDDLPMNRRYFLL